MYTWGYIREAILAKLNQTEAEANAYGFLNRFPIYANEAMTQICSIKPQYTFFETEVYNEHTYNNLETVMLRDARSQWEQDANNIIDPGETGTPDLQPGEPGYIEPVAPTYDETYWAEYKQEKIEDFRREHVLEGDIVRMPENFLAFGDNVNRVSETYWSRGRQETVIIERVATMNDFRFHGSHSLQFLKAGKYKISYKAYWYKFTNALDVPDNDTDIDVPRDILDAIPSYVAGQCFKIVDEQKAMLFMNEFNIFLSRLDDTDFKQQQDFNTEGNW
jgi:hypothetical protein